MHHLRANVATMAAVPSCFTRDSSLWLCCVVNAEQWGRGYVPGFSLAGDAMVGLAVSSEQVALVVVN